MPHVTMKPLDLHFIEFLLSRTDPFLLSYSNQSDIGAWRSQVHATRLPQWQSLNCSVQLNNQITAFIADDFGLDKLPILRRRYSSFCHRQRKQTKAIDIDAAAYTALTKVISQYQLSSYSEAILWMAREVSTPQE